MKNLVALLLLASFGFNVAAQKKPVAKRKVVLGTTEAFEQLPKLRANEVSEAAFNQLPSPKAWTMPYVETENGHFYIQTAKGRQKFKTYSNGGARKGWNGYELLGFLSRLNYYAISNNSSAEGIGFGQLFLLDAKNGFRYPIASFGDWHVGLPLPSVNYLNFVYYENTAYQHKNTDIGVLQYDPKAPVGQAWKAIASLHSNDFAVEEIRWASDSVFYIKGYEEVYQQQKWLKNYSYYQVELPQNSGHPSINRQ